MNYQNKKIIGLVVIIAVILVGYIAMRLNKDVVPAPLDTTPQNVTLSGTYVCLLHLDTTGPQTEECAFGIQTTEGDYYAVDFGASAEAMAQFQVGQSITAEGFVVIKEALSSDQWAKYNMKGIFTITNMIGPDSANGKLNIDVVCESALAYMSFPDGASAEAFVAECKEGKHPQVIEQYKEQMGLGEGVAI
jgi:primosomal replication protein N